MSLWCDKSRPTSFDQLDYQLEQAVLLQTLVHSFHFRSIIIVIDPWTMISRSTAEIFLISWSLDRVVRGKRLEFTVFCARSMETGSNRYAWRNINSRRLRGKRSISRRLEVTFMFKSIRGLYHAPISSHRRRRSKESLIVSVTSEFTIESSFKNWSKPSLRLGKSIRMNNVRSKVWR